MYRPQTPSVVFSQNDKYCAERKLYPAATLQAPFLWAVIQFGLVTQTQACDNTECRTGERMALCTVARNQETAGISGQVVQPGSGLLA